MPEENELVTVASVKKEVKSFVAQLPMEVKNKGGSDAAKIAVVRVRTEQKRRKEWFEEKILKPAKASLDQAKDTYNKQRAVLAEILQPMVDWDRETSSNILTWEARERARIQKEQEAENAKFAKRIEKAEAKGKPVEAVKPPKVLAPTAKTIKAEAGGFTTKTVKVPRIVDESKIPDFFYDKELSLPRIKAALIAGQPVPGAILVEELQSSVRTA